MPDLSYMKSHARSETEELQRRNRELSILNAIAEALIVLVNDWSTLYIAERTVKFRVSAIMDKLGAGNRSGAVAAAAQRGLVKLS